MRRDSEGPPAAGSNGHRGAQSRSRDVVGIRRLPPHCDAALSAAAGTSADSAPRQPPGWPPVRAHVAARQCVPERLLQPASSPEEAQCQEDLHTQQQKRKERAERLEELSTFWKGKASQLESAVQTHAGHLAQKQQELEDLDRVPERVFPGPRSLRWVEGNCANLVASVVVIANLSVMVQEALQGEYWDVPDLCFLIYFVLELVLRASLYQEEFLCGCSLQVALNYLDLIIVVFGALDILMRPVIQQPVDGWGAVAFRSLRMLRILRIVKLFNVFMRADLSWTEKDHFNVFIMGMIFASSLAMSFELDYPDLPFWFYWEHLVLVVFFFEIAARIKQVGPISFLLAPEGRCWNYFDTFIVGAGVVDQWLFPAARVLKILMGMPVDKGGGSELGTVLRVVRMLRLFRIMRLLRLIKRIPPLYNLLIGITQAMASMMWVVVLTVVILYAWALLTVATLRDGLVEVDCSNKESDGDLGAACPFEKDAHGHAGESEHPRCVFSSVAQTMLILFELMNGHMSAFEDMLVCIPWIKPFIILYMAVSCLTILPTLTAVVSDNMLNSTRETKTRLQNAQEEALSKRKRAMVGELIDNFDKSPDAYVKKHDFDNMLKEPHLNDILAVTAKLHVMDMRGLFDLLERGEQVRRKTLLESLDLEAKSVNLRKFMRFEKRLSHLEATLEYVVSAAQSTQSELRWLTGQMCAGKRPADATTD